MQPTTYTNAVGTAQVTKDVSHPFSPYIKAIAPLPVVSTNKDSTAISVESKASETTPDGTSMGDSGGRELARG